MSKLNPDQFTVTELLHKAMPGHTQAEAALKHLLNRMKDSNNGQVIHLPGGPPKQLQGPQPIELLASTVQAINILLQTNRLMMVALEALDERLSNLRPAREHSKANQ